MSSSDPILKLFQYKIHELFNNETRGERYLSLSFPFSLALWSKTENEKLTYLLPHNFHKWWLLVHLYMFALDTCFWWAESWPYPTHCDILRHRVGLSEYVLPEQMNG